MKVQICENNGVTGWQFGESGRCFVGREAFQKAKREQMKALGLLPAKERKEFAERTAKKAKEVKQKTLKAKLKTPKTK